MNVPYNVIIISLIQLDGDKHSNLAHIIMWIFNEFCPNQEC